MTRRKEIDAIIEQLQKDLTFRVEDVKNAKNYEILQRCINEAKEVIEDILFYCKEVKESK